jgi:hypothetical protein
MTSEDIIRIAKEVGFSDGEIDTCQLMFERFATLVAQQENERIAQKIEQLPFGDTSASFAIYVRECPPCNGNCNQGRTCPARK